MGFLTQSMDAETLSSSGNGFIRRKRSVVHGNFATVLESYRGSLVLGNEFGLLRPESEECGSTLEFQILPMPYLRYFSIHLTRSLSRC